MSGARRAATLYATHTDYWSQALQMNSKTTVIDLLRCDAPLTRCYLANEFGYALYIVSSRKRSMRRSHCCPCFAIWSLLNHATHRSAIVCVCVCVCVCDCHAHSPLLSIFHQRQVIVPVCSQDDCFDHFSG